jgi:DNA-directed RNA polymerase subunit RPC12/RpoP
MSDEEAELRHKITHWFTVLTFARSKYDRTGKTEDLDSATYAQAKMNQYEDQLATLTGRTTNPTTAVPLCGCGPCGRPMSTFGTYREGDPVWLCPRCDFRQCQGCQEPIHSLTAVECPRCGFIVGAPKSVDDELD